MRREREPGQLKHRNKTFEDNATLNQWVVPYNPFFSHKYNCHINLEVCTSITAVKYLFKYVYKGPDKAVLAVEAVNSEARGSRRAANAEPAQGREDNQQNPNEILKYLDAWYISPMEVVLNIINATLHDKTCSVTMLNIHLPGRQNVTYQPSEDPRQVLLRGARTMLTAAFEIWASDDPDVQVAKRMLYQELPKKFRWDSKNKRWILRMKNIDSIGRMVPVSPRDHERFHLRAMLSHRAGPTSYEDLRIVGGVVYPTFKDAAMHTEYLEHEMRLLSSRDACTNSGKSPSCGKSYSWTLLPLPSNNSCRLLSVWNLIMSDLVSPSRDR